MEREKRREGILKRRREGKENGDRPPAIFGFKFALSAGLNTENTEPLLWPVCTVCWQRSIVS